MHVPLTGLDSETVSASDFLGSDMLSLPGDGHILNSMKEEVAKHLLWNMAHRVLRAQLDQKTASSSMCGHHTSQAPSQTRKI
jgi:hypothetical protein